MSKKLGRDSVLRLSSVETVVLAHKARKSTGCVHTVKVNHHKDNKCIKCCSFHLPCSTTSIKQPEKVWTCTHVSVCLQCKAPNMQMSSPSTNLNCGLVNPYMAQGSTNRQLVLFYFPSSSAEVK